MQHIDHKTELFVALQRLLPKHWLSRTIGKIAESELKWLKNLLIQAAIGQFKIDLTEAEHQSLDSYKTFNDFFTRALQAGAREIDKLDTSIVSPADGAVSQTGHLNDYDVFQAKGIEYSAVELLGSEIQAAQYLNGSFATIYLSPRDYHRVHIPCSARLMSTRYIPGSLFSVNDATVSALPGLFARNERLVCEFESESGHFALILVGAMLVAGIQTVWGGDELANPGYVRETDFSARNLDFKKGDEIGRFKFGSTVILLFPNDRIEWNPEFFAGQKTKMGQSMAHFVDR